MRRLEHTLQLSNFEIMAYTQYGAVVADNAEDLVAKLAESMAHGWQPWGIPVSITAGFQLLQAVAKGASNVGGALGDITSDRITDASDVGNALLVSVDADAAPAAIGGGTSDFRVPTTT